MIFTQTPLAGPYLIDPERIMDERGFFARTWCHNEFERHGLEPRLVQCNISFNVRRGTIRGMHYQAKPHEEIKLVRCTQGAIYDVIVDVRPESPTYLRWFAEELTAENRRMFYIPGGFAHGFQTLSDGAEVSYQMSDFFQPQSSRGIRYDDPALGIAWSLDVSVISAKDQSYPFLESGRGV
jgi:dTDP-4-dehydrorhamnose 3,5-epimerase